MKFRSAAQRSAVIIAILILSIVFGYIYQTVGYRMDLEKHPREYSEFVSKYVEEYGVPEYIIYGLILTESEFQSNFLSEDGKIGLMQISPETYKSMQTMTKESAESGILYDPETNIRYGTYRLSYLFTEYSRWKTVIAIYVSDEDTVRGWLENPAYTDENGNLTEIPDVYTAEKAALIEEKAEMYRKLYYSE